MNEFRPRLLFSEMSLFLIVQFLGLWTGYTLLKTVPVPPRMETFPSIVWFLAAFLIATSLMLILMKYFKGKLFFSSAFAFLVFIGSEAVFSIFVPPYWSIALAVAVVAARFLWPSVLTQNIAIILAVAGVGAQLGILLTVPAIIILLIVLSVYDVWAVFKSKHMIKMFKGMMQRGAAMALVIPESLKHITKPMQSVQTEKLKAVPTKRFMMLGTGDLAFPLVFAVAALEYSLLSAIGVILGALAGILVIHILIIQKKFTALPALPPIAAGSIAGFIFVQLLNFI